MNRISCAMGLVLAGIISIACNNDEQLPAADATFKDVKSHRSDLGNNPDKNLKVVEDLVPDRSKASSTCTVTAGGSARDYGRGVVVDSSGHLYMIGTFKGTATFGSTTLTSRGSQDAFVAKIDPSCKFVWTVPISGTGSDDGNAIARDASGNLYVTGEFEGSLSCGSKTLVSKGQSDIYVIKMDPSGKPIWCSSAGGTDFDHSIEIKVDKKGNSYIAGDYRQTSATFGTITRPCKGNYDMVVAKLDSKGAFLWATAGGGADEDHALALAVDDQEQIYFTGYYLGSATVGATPLVSKGMRDTFVAKLNADGSPAWVTPISGSFNDIGNEIALDGAGGLYVTGNTRSSPTTFGTLTKSPAGSAVFVGKLNLEGVFSWVSIADGTQTRTSNCLAVDAAGNSYIAGYFDKQATFGSTSFNSGFWAEIFVTKLDPKGNFIWATSGKGSGWDSAIDIALDAAGNSHVVGFFSNTVTLGSKVLTTQGTTTDIFVAKLDAKGGI